MVSDRTRISGGQVPDRQIRSAINRVGRLGCLNSDRYEYVDANSVKLPDDYRKTGKNDPEQISIVRHKGMI